jgi:hypothetical protein
MQKSLIVYKGIGPAALPSLQRIRTAIGARDPAKDRGAADYAKALDGLMDGMKGKP